VAADECVDGLFGKLLPNPPNKCPIDCCTGVITVGPTCAAFGVPNVKLVCAGVDIPGEGNVGVADELGPD
jgi:hypothetical protein